MSPALIQIFAFMTCTFALGLFLGWSLWRHGGVSRAAMDDLEAKADFLKKSLDQSRRELWSLQDGEGMSGESAPRQGRTVSRHRTVERAIARNAMPSNPPEPAQG